MAEPFACTCCAERFPAKGALATHCKVAHSLDLRYLQHPYYQAWLAHDLDLVKALWGDNRHKRSTALRLALGQFLDRGAGLAALDALLEFFCEAAPAGSRAQRRATLASEVLRAVGDARFRGSFHHQLARSMVDRGIITGNARREAAWREQEVWVVLRSAAVRRLGSAAPLRRLPAELIRMVRDVL